MVQIGRQQELQGPGVEAEGGRQNGQAHEHEALRILVRHGKVRLEEVETEILRARSSNACSAKQSAPFPLPRFPSTPSQFAAIRRRSRTPRK